jgi:8-oxo-dGTP pyrophosphatase MutT (NUDIX family)
MPKNNELEKHFTASALIIDDSKVLLLHHKKLGVWLYPGGHIEINETPDQTVVREVKEETGLDIKVLGDMDKNLADDNADVSVLHQPYAILCELVGDHYHNDLIYLCKVIGDKKIRYTEGESKKIQFFGHNELDKIKLFPNFRNLLEKVFKTQKLK